RAFGAEKMNYELLAMGDAHLHWHLYPRRTGDIGEYGNQVKGPVWWLPINEMYDASTHPSAEEFAEIKKLLAAELDKLL
ncbi:hypothetical protein, partial [Escherichia coli]|uniref:hypothetical protein n=1 Tax=Escherichia coli TaxID=562 RepID=UPI00390C7EF5